MGTAHKAKAKKTGPVSIALLWGLDRGTPKGDAVRAILKELGAVTKTPLPERLGDTAAAALGLVGARPALVPYAGPVPECEFMLLANFPEPLLKEFLARSRQAGAVVGCKAVLTKANRDWRMPLSRLRCRPASLKPRPSQTAISA